MGREHDQRGAPALTHVRIRFRHQELLLADGTYLLGRDASCHIVLEDSRASRRHARLTVESGMLLLDDLGSLNGVLVNGVRVTEQRALFDGDWITIGGDEIEIAIRNPHSRGDRVQTQDELTPIPPSTRLEADARISVPPDEDEPTLRSRSLEILGSIVDQALRTDRLSDAEDLLRTTLVDVSQEALEGAAIEEHARDFCVQYGLELAKATRKPEWLEYVLDLLRVTAAPCSPELAASLAALLRTADIAKLDAWAARLHETDDAEARASAQAVLRLGQTVSGRRAH
ncbi:MAG: FHA domain-containing protein [Polyangiaceae bacterium]|nr:FHA domain-containing protein [Polyangiaceae bacterium]